jgi:attachment p12 family protein
MMGAIAGIAIAALLFGIFTALRPSDRSGKVGCTGNCGACTNDGACESKGVKV